MEFHFDFIVSGLNEKQAEELLNLIIQTADGLGGQVGGGFAPVSESEVRDGQENTE